MNTTIYTPTNSLYWIGTRESEIYCTGSLFKGSITIFGSNKNFNYAFDKTYSWRFNYNLDNEEVIKFVNETASKILAKDPSAKFMMYFPDEKYEYSEEIQENCICQNDFDLLNLLGNKIYSKLWLNNTVNQLPYVTMTGKEINDKIHLLFNGYDQFVIQSAYSCGGFGTKLYDGTDESLHGHTLYMITPYIKKNIPINMHIIIYSEEVVFLPPSIQIISLTKNMFLYKGADFIAYERLPLAIKQKIILQVKNIAKKLQHCGYRGVCGIDLLYDFEDDIVYYSEINARFQSSTFLLNKVLNKKGISIQKLHYEAFYESQCNRKEQLNINVPYSFYSYQYDEILYKPLQYIHSAYVENNFEIYDDELNWKYRLDTYTHLFKVVFARSIVSWEPDNTIHIPENIAVNYIDFKMYKDPEEYFIYLKIALLNQGVSISKDVLKYIEAHRKINCKEFEAIDMKLANDLYFNVPFQVRLSELSPFSIEFFSECIYGLCYYGNKIIEVFIRTEDKLASKRTKNGVVYEDIAYMGNDRLRIYHRQSCYFKSINKGCHFCDLDGVKSPFEMEEIKEVIDAYQDNPQVKHFLIGGGSESPNSDFKNILDLAKYIKSVYEKPIYLMSLPPKSIVNAP